MTPTSIEWSGLVWNPLRGCSRISPGCENCYAEGIAERFSGPGLHFEGYATRGKGWTRKIDLLVDKLTEPLRLRKPSTIFVNSMSDPFHEGVSNEDIAAIFGIMAACPQHTFQVLTKRAARMVEWFSWLASGGGASQAVRCAIHARHLLDVQESHALKERVNGCHGENFAPWPLPNVHLGVSAENQSYAEARIPLLLRTPAAVRWVSLEPLLGPVNLEWLRILDRQSPHTEVTFDALHETVWRNGYQAGCALRCQRLDWVVVGGESGRRARPFNLGWARSIRDACAAAGVPFFMKQLGAAPFDHLVMKRDRPIGGVRLLLKDRHGGVMEEWPPDLRVRQYPRATAGGAP